MILDTMIEAFFLAWRPGEPLTLSTCLRADAGIDPQIQAVISGAILPPFGPSAQAWCEIHQLLRYADAAGDEDRRALLRERARDHLVRCARAHLAGKPLPRPRRRAQASEDRRATGAHGARTSGTSRDTELLPEAP